MIREESAAVHGAHAGQAEALADPEAPPPGGRRRPPIIAVVLSVLAPGLGHWYAGRPRRTVAWVVAASLLWFATLAILLYLPVAGMNVALALGAWVGYYMALLVDAWRSARDRGRRPIAPWERWWACLLVALALVAIAQTQARFVRAFLGEAWIMSAAGMADTLMPGDRVLADKLWYRHRPIRRDEVVVFFSEGRGSPVWVKRVIGLPGDTIAGRDDTLYRNGEPLDEPYATFDHDSPHASIPELTTFAPLTVPEGEVFLVGDNRHTSNDSRLRGTTPLSDIIGPVRVIYWSHPPPPAPAAPAHRPATGVSADAGVRWERVGRRVR